MISVIIFYTIQIFTIAIKLDTSVGWEWKEIFWTYWVFFSIMVGFTLGVLILFCGKIILYFTNKTNVDEIKGALWLLIVISSVSANSCLIVVGFIEYFQSNIIHKLSVGLFTTMLMLFVVGIQTYYQERIIC